MTTSTLRLNWTSLLRATSRPSSLSSSRLRRSYATATDGPPPPPTLAPYEVFDRNAKRLQRDRAASRDGGDRSRLVDYLRREVAERVMERFEVRPSPLSPSDLVQLDELMGGRGECRT